MKKHYKTKTINITKLKSYLEKKPNNNKTNARQPSSRTNK